MDEAILRKFIIDNDNTGDDRRITTLTKLFLKWMNQDPTSDSAKSALDTITSTIRQCELSMKKAGLVHRTNERELERYQAESAKVQQQTVAALAQIEECKRELENAKRVRRHRQEYDALAGIIMKYPGRKEIVQKIDAVRKRLEENRRRKQQMQQRMELRKKQFHVLMVSLQQLKKMLEEEPKTVEGPSLPSDVANAIIVD